MVSVVLLPGMDGGGALFAEFIEALGSEFAPIVVSYPCDVPLDYAGLVEFVRARLPPQLPYVLLAESFSGPVAIALAASKPAGLLGLVLCCSFARNPRPVLRALRALSVFIPITRKLTGLLGPILFGRFDCARLRDALRSALDPISAPVLRARLDAVYGLDYSALLPRIDVPVLYLQAAQDRVVPASAARHIRATVPVVRVLTFDGPHLLLQAVPVEAAEHVHAFVFDEVLADRFTA